MFAGSSVAAPGALTGFPARSVRAFASTQVPGPSNAVVIREKPAPTASTAPGKISVGVSKRPPTSRFPTAVLVKKTPAPVAPKNRIGSGISKYYRASNNNSSRKNVDDACNIGTELSSWKQRLAKETKDDRGICSHWN